MDKESKDLYLEKLTSLTEEEKRERSKYLRKFGTENMQGPLTNVPYFDEKWTYNYDDEALGIKIPEMNMYEMIYEYNKDHLKDIALVFVNKNITYGELFENIQKYARCLIASGVKEGDSVALPLPSTPEAVYLFYACQMLGATANLIDLRKDNEEINHALTVGKSSIMFTLDLAKGKLLKCLEGTEVKEVISLSSTESLPKVVQFIAAPKNFTKNFFDNMKSEGYTTFKSFIGRDNSNIEIPKLEFMRNRPAFTVYTSGTTGKSKAVLISADTANFKIVQYMNNGMVWERQDTYLNIIPLFLAFGSVVGLHLPLVMGMKDVLIPSYENEKTADYFIKYRPEHLSLTPSSFRKLIESPKFSKVDLSNAKTFGCGGDGISAEEEKIINEALASRGAKVPLTNGYGASEVGAPFSTQTADYNKAGTTGMPLPTNNILIVDRKTNEILEENQIGDVLMVSDTPMIEYIGREDLTNAAKVDIGNGVYGVNLGDQGLVDSEGNVMLKGRTIDVIGSEDNPLYPIDIENIAFTTSMIRDAAAIKVENYDFAIYVTPDDGVDQSEFEELFNEKLSENGYDNLNYSVQYIENMPLNPNGKNDKAQLKEDFANIKRI